MTYPEQLKQPEWFHKRLEILVLRNFTCECCGIRKFRIQVHHRYYVSHRLAWEYPNFCYVAICDGCHETTTYAPDNARDEHGVVNFQEWEILLEMLGDGAIAKLRSRIEIQKEVQIAP